MAIKTENWDGVAAPSIPAGWSVDAGLVTTSTFGSSIVPTSSPNALKLPLTGNNSHKYATWNTPDSNSGDVTVSAKFNGDATTDTQKFGVMARGSDSSLSGSDSFYWLRLDIDSNVLALFKMVTGTSTLLSSVIVSLAVPTWYTVNLTLTGTLLQCLCQRLSDNKYLDSSGTFQTGSRYAIQLNDSSIAGAGYAGLSLQSRSDDVYSDDWSFDNTVPQIGDFRSWSKPFTATRRYHRRPNAGHVFIPIHIGGPIIGPPPGRVSRGLVVRRVAKDRFRRGSVSIGRGTRPNISGTVFKGLRLRGSRYVEHGWSMGYPLYLELNRNTKIQIVRSDRRLRRGSIRMPRLIPNAPGTPLKFLQVFRKTPKYRVTVQPRLPLRRLVDQPPRMGRIMVVKTPSRPRRGRVLTMRPNRMGFTGVTPPAMSIRGNRYREHGWSQGYPLYIELIEAHRPLQIMGFHPPRRGKVLVPRMIFRPIMLLKALQVRQDRRLRKGRTSAPPRLPNQTVGAFRRSLQVIGSRRRMVVKTWKAQSFELGGDPQLIPHVDPRKAVESPIVAHDISQIDPRRARDVTAANPSNVDPRQAKRVR